MTSIGQLAPEPVNEASIEALLGNFVKSKVSPVKLKVPEESESSSSEQDASEPTSAFAKARLAMRNAADFSGLIAPKGWSRAPKGW